MSDSSLHIRTTLSAHDRASPVIQKLLANVRKLEAVANRLSTSFASAGRSGMTAMAGFDRASKAASAQIQGLSNVSRNAAKSYAAEWKRASDQRLSEARRMYSALERLESSYQRRQSASRQPARVQGRASSGGSGRGGFMLLPGNYGLIAGGAAAAAVKGAFEARMKADTAEVKSRIFGELTREQIKSERRKWIDRDSVKYGTNASDVIDAFNESLKAGFSTDAARKITEGALKSQSALELDVAPLIKMSAKVATIFGGNIKDVDPARVVKMMNAIGVAAAETAADPQDVIEGFKKGNAALAMANGKMAEGDLAAMLAVAVSGGIQPSKAGNAISNLVSKLIGGRGLTGKKAADLDEAAGLLGFGNRKKLADQSAADPTAVMLRIFKKMNEMSAQNKVRVAQLLGGSEWDDELGMMANSVVNMAETIKKTRTKVDLLDKASAEQLNSLRGRWNSVGTAFVLHFEKIGEGLEGNFRDLADWLLEHSARIDNDRLTENVRRFADTIKRKLAPVVGLLGFVGDILSKIGDMITKLDEWFGGTIVEKAFKKMQSTAASIIPGLGGMPAGKIITDLLTGIVTEILKFGIKKPNEKSGEDGAPKIQKQSFLDDSKRAGQEFRKAAFFSNADDYRKYVTPASYTGSSGGHGGGGSYGSKIINTNGTPLHTSSPGAAIPNLLGNGGIIRRDKIPSFNGRGESAANFQPSGSFSGKAPQIMNRLINDFGLTKEQAAGIVGNLGHETGGFSLMQEKNPRGGGRGGYGWAQWTGSRRRDFEAYCKQNGLDPKSDEANYGFLKHELSTNYRGAISAVQGTNSVGDATRAFESTYEKSGVKNMRSRNSYANQALAGFTNPAGESMKGGVGGGRFSGGIVDGVDLRIQEIVKAGAIHLPDGYSVRMSSGFRGHGAPNHNGNAADYQIIGPDGKALSNRGDDPTGMYQLLARHSYGEMLARYPKLKGAFAWGGAFGTKLGGGGPRDLMHFDVNGERGRYSQYQLRNLGSVPGTQYGVTNNVPSPAESVQNVPSSIRGDASLGLQRGGGRPVQIHINGSSHDPEALATLVQRRIDESMNWRTHDTSSEYT